jgi:PadR family transcriptional regulator PadR
MWRAQLGDLGGRLEQSRLMLGSGWQQEGRPSAITRYFLHRSYARSSRWADRLYALSLNSGTIVDVGADPVPITNDMAVVLRAFLSDPAIPRFGFDLMRGTGLSSSALYPILARLEHLGWVEGGREVIDSRSAGRLARRQYLITPTGLSAARIELAHAMDRLHSQPVLLRPGLVGGHA